MSAAAESDPSRSSYYINDAFYRALIADFSEWQREDRLVRDTGLREECRMLLEREARLLDRRLFEEWLSLYARECLYWMPATAEGGDPRREVANAFDDRRRVEDRLFRLKTGFAWSQIPPSRTVRTVGNVEPFRAARDGVLMVRSNLMLSEFRAGETRLYAASCGHRLARRGSGWEIEVKQVNLIDCDQNLRNPSIVF
jgi:3-phenylpropionate/cinnamic acid dioxygenase small subunit